MYHNRRDFLKICLSSALFCACVDKSSPKKLAPPSTRDVFYSGATKADGTFVVMKSWRDGSMEFQVENEIHSVVYSKALNLKVYLPKQNKAAYFQTGDSPLKKFSPADKMFFYGHGVIDEKRGVFYSTQASVSSVYDDEQKNAKGEIYIHQLSDFAIIGNFPSHGYAPHDLLITKDELVICNAGKETNLAFINLDDKSLVHKVEKKNFPHVSFSHLTKMDDSRFVIAGASRDKNHPAEVFIASKGADLITLTVPEGMNVLMREQILSIVYHDGYIFGTSPRSGFLLSWKADGMFHAAHEIKGISSLSYSQEFGGLIVGTIFKDGPLFIAKPKGGYLDVKKMEWKPRSTGSHSVVIEELLPS